MKKEWHKPRLVVSSCLNKEKCRYNGEDSPCKVLDELREYVDIIPVCPEMGIGLKVPRDAIRVVGTSEEYNLIDPKSSNDLTQKMIEFSNEKIKEYIKDGIDGVILKGRSPSCGIKDVKIYQTKEKGSMSVKGQGLFAKYLVNAMGGSVIEEDGRLRSFEIRDNFFMKIFALAEFNQVQNTASIGKLVEYHTKNKLLFMTYSPDITKKLGCLTANKDMKKNEVIMSEYRELLGIMLQNNQKFRRCTHVFEKAYGYVSDYLYDDERVFFRNTLEEYKNGKQAKKTIITILKGYAIRFDNEYLLGQTLLEPYPEKLLNLDDSGKGIAR
ncbi:MAG: YbgA family protein [Sarcina sp.]